MKCDKCETHMKKGGTRTGGKGYGPGGGSWRNIYRIYNCPNCYNRVEKFEDAEDDEPFDAAL